MSLSDRTSLCSVGVAVSFRKTLLIASLLLSSVLVNKVFCAFRQQTVFVDTMAQISFINFGGGQEIE